MSLPEAPALLAPLLLSRLRPGGVSRRALLFFGRRGARVFNSAARGLPSSLWCFRAAVLETLGNRAFDPSVAHSYLNHERCSLVLPEIDNRVGLSGTNESMAMQSPR